MAARTSSRLKTRKQHCTLGDLWRVLNLVPEGDVAAELAKLSPSKDVVRKMLKELNTAGKTWDPLVRYARKSGLVGLRSHPQAGDVRDYVVQQSDDQVFLRVPVGHLGAVKGQVMKVRFLPDRVVAER